MKENHLHEMKDMFFRAAAVLLSAGIALAAFSACSGKSGSVSSPSDKQDTAGSEEKTAHIGAGEAIRLLVAGKEDGEFFLLRSDWHGEEFDSEDSLQKLMMARYSPSDIHAPTAADGDTVSIVFDPSEPSPSEVSLTQIANTVRANTGIPYSEQEPELLNDGGYTYSFEVGFGEFDMFYYLLECRWTDGNSATFCFALEKEGSYPAE